MKFYNEAWFWTGVFTLLGSLFGVLITAIITNNTQIKLEKLKFFSSRKFDSYCKLYYFILTRIMHKIYFQFFKFL